MVDKSFSLIDIVEVDFGIVLILGYLNHVFKFIIQFADIVVEFSDFLNVISPI